MTTKITQGDKETQNIPSHRIKPCDFIEIDYAGRVKASSQIFDLTDEKLAKQEGVFDQSHKYGPITVCVGEQHVLAGLDEFLVDKEIGKEYEADVPPERGFGRRIANLVKLASTAKFKQQNIAPFPGLQFAIDGVPCVVRSVSGGRVLLDFNHPLAGKVLHYWVRINKRVTDTEKKLACIAGLMLRLPDKDFVIRIKNQDAEVELKKKLPEPALSKFEQEVKRLIPDIKKLDITKPEK